MIARRTDNTLKEGIFRRTQVFSNYLHFEPLWCKFIHSDLQFLSTTEIDQLQCMRTDHQRANRLLTLLKKKPSFASLKFVACLCLESEHRGHRILFNKYKTLMSGEEKEKLEELIKLFQSTMMSPESSRSNSPAPEMSSLIVQPQRPLPPFDLTGDLADCDKSYHKLDQHLWNYFSYGKFNDLEKLVVRTCSNPDSPDDWRIVAMWFHGLIIMHKDNDYERSITEFFEPALQMCSATESENKLILEGRIYQRMSQVYLCLNRTELATEFFERAKELLQFVSRGYDKCNMFCREAKLSSAKLATATACTKKERDSIENLFSNALECVPRDAPYSPASLPSLILSKTAFHLHISFGKAQQGLEPPVIDDEDVKKAKGTLQRLELGDIMLDIRKCEHQLIVAELLRIKNKLDEAVTEYSTALEMSRKANLIQIATIAESRIKYIEKENRKAELIEKLLFDLPEIQ